MKILMLSWEYPPRIIGGISRVVHDLAQTMAKQGNEVHVVTCWENGAAEFEKDKAVFVHRVHPYDIGTNDFITWVMQLNFAILDKAVGLCNEIDFDIVHAHDWLVGFAAKTLKNSFKLPMISTIHATENGRNHGIHNDMQSYINSVEWMLTYESWRVICNSSYMKNELMNVFKLPEDKLAIINNGVSLDSFNGINRDYNFRRNYASDHEKIIFFVGRLVQEKGVQVLIDSIPKVLQYYNDVKFVIAGKGPQYDYLKYQSDAIGVASKVYFTGYLSDENLKKLYKCADVAVFPSLYEPFGIVALEGMVANVPVVVSDTCGLGEIVEHGVDGMKAYTGNANSLADCIIDILYNPGKTEKMKIKALAKVKELYNWDKIALETIEVYKDVLKKSEDFSNNKTQKKEVTKTLTKKVSSKSKKDTIIKTNSKEKELVKTKNDDVSLDNIVLRSRKTKVAFEELH